MEMNYQIPRASLLWILLAVVLVMLPQAFRMPLWVTLIALLCVTWRLLIHAGKLSYPGRWARTGVVLFTLVVTVTQLRDLGMGLDSAAALLALGFVFKLIEMREKRDIYVVFSLCFIMTMVSFLYSQSALTTVYIALSIVVITGAMIALNRTRPGQVLNTAGMAVRIGLQALPLTIVLFMVFPRIAPLWSVPFQSRGDTGVTDEMSPGDLAQLGRSSELAFRVQFENGPPPLHQALYWRGLVLDSFDGTTWRRDSRSSSYGRAARLNDFSWTWEDRVRFSGEPLNYNIIMEATQQPWVFGLHLAQRESSRLLQSRDFELFNDGPINNRFGYDLSSYLDNQTDLILLDSQRRGNTALPEAGNTRSRDFARELRASVDTDLDYVYQVLAHFQQNPFFYTLSPALLGEQRIDDFLFNTRSGFCEHYASTFAFLMRAVGIPARVVVGYQGAEYNRYEDYMMVYQYNAHAWNEVWLEGRGWVRFDPTSAVSPERIEQGMEAALGEDPAFMEQSLLSATGLGQLGWLNALRLRLDALEYEWNRRVVTYDEEAQYEFFEELFGEVTDEKIILLLLGVASLVVVVLAFIVIRRPPRSPRDPVNRLYRKVGRQLGRAGLDRRPGEGPLAWRDRVSAARPELAELMRELTDVYMDINYRHRSVPPQQRRQDMRALKALLQQLRIKMLRVARLSRH
ncbi:MAG: DUF3488 and transglutaminase-like domain-containing protein [Pseudohongiellaceae bacterium]